MKVNYKKIYKILVKLILIIIIIISNIGIYLITVLSSVLKNQTKVIRMKTIEMRMNILSKIHLGVHFKLKCLVLHFYVFVFY